MRMGNYLCLWAERSVVMSATESSFGMRHLTVVPTNFEPPAEGVDEAVDGEPNSDEAVDDPAVDLQADSE